MLAGGRALIRRGQLAPQFLDAAPQIATELGLRHEGTRTVVYADERREERPVTNVTIKIGNLATWTEAIVGPAGSQVLIGQVVLEMLDLIADCRNRTLAPRHPEGPVLAIR